MAIPTDLSAHDMGLLLEVVDYGHLLRWTGASWEFIDGGSGYFLDCVVAPSGPGWALCDGSTTDYLSVSPTLHAEPITLPDEVTNPVYHASAAAYTGTVTAPTAPGLSGNTGNDSASVEVQSGTGTTVSAHTHTHPVGSLAVDATGEPRHLGVLKYFRR
jgi:hypothetical protein